jgi:hypothetical protein
MAERGAARKKIPCEWRKAGESRRGEAGLRSCSSRRGGRIRRLCGRRQRGAGGFLDETCEVEEAGKGIADQGGLGRVIQAEVRRALEAEAGLGGIAGFGIRLSADAELPEIGTDLDIASEANGAIGESETHGEGHTEGMSGIGEGAGGKRGLVGDGEVGPGLVQALASA